MHDFYSKFFELANTLIKIYPDNENCYFDFKFLLGMFFMHNKLFNLSDVYEWEVVAKDEKETSEDSLINPIPELKLSKLRS